jgi:hypothetical protein
VIATYPQFVYEGPVFTAYTQPVVGTVAVNRFYNVQTGTHFYTISPTEIAYIRANYPQYLFEGPVYYAPPSAADDGRTALYRFYNQATGAHFFTASSSERDHVIATYPQFIYEGVAYYAFGAPVSPPGNPGNIAPKVSLVASAATIPVPGQVTLTATAFDDDGQVVKVMFYQGSTKLTEMTTTPYSYTLNVGAAGDYTYSAIAVDNLSAMTTSAGVAVHAGAAPNLPPLVALAASTTTLASPGPVILTANASDPDGTVALVTLYQGGVKLVDPTTAPYVYTATLSSAGDYAFAAQATDNLGATATSSGVSVHVNGTQPPISPSADIYRLLNQATFGFTQSEAARVKSMGIRLDRRSVHAADVRLSQRELHDPATRVVDDVHEPGPGDEGRAAAVRPAQHLLSRQPDADPRPARLLHQRGLEARSVAPARRLGVVADHGDLDRRPRPVDRLSDDALPEHSVPAGVRQFRDVAQPDHAVAVDGPRVRTSTRRSRPSAWRSRPTLPGNTRPLRSTFSSPTPTACAPAARSRCTACTTTVWAGRRTIVIRPI